MDINQKLQQLNLTYSVNPTPPGNGYIYPQWKIDFITKLLQLTITTTNGGNVFGTVRTDDPNNKSRLDPEFGDAGVYSHNGGTQRFYFEPKNSQPENKRQCVALIQGGSYNVGPTKHWRDGPPASAGLPRFSIVATFHGSDKDSGEPRYNDLEKGHQHVGIYVGADSQGIYLLSQNMEGTGSNPVGGIDLRRFLFSSSHPTGGANNYYRVKIASNQ